MYVFSSKDYNKNNSKSKKNRGKEMKQKIVSTFYIQLTLETRGDITVLHVKFFLNNQLVKLFMISFCFHFICRHQNT